MHQCKLLFLQAFGAKCQNGAENPLLTGNRRILCKKTHCHFSHSADVHALFRETYRHAERSLAGASATSGDELDEYDWNPKYFITLLEVPKIVIIFNIVNN